MKIVLGYVYRIPNWCQLESVYCLQARRTHIVLLKRAKPLEKLSSIHGSLQILHDPRGKDDDTMINWTLCLYEQQKHPFAWLAGQDFSVPYLLDTGGTIRRTLLGTHCSPASQAHSVSSVCPVLGHPTRRGASLWFQTKQQPPNCWAESAMAFALLLRPDTAPANRSPLRIYSVVLLHSLRGFDWDDVYIEHPILQTLPFCRATETRDFITHLLQMEVNFWAKTTSLFAVLHHPRKWSPLVFSLPTPLQ